MTQTNIKRHLNIKRLLTRKTRLLKARATVAVAAVIAAGAAHAFDAEFYDTQSVMRSGHWVRIDAGSDEGMHQITFDQLRQWGFADPTKCRVYGLGGTHLAKGTFGTDDHDDLHPTLSYATDDGRLLFYSDGPVRVTLTGSQRTNEGYRIERNHYSDHVFFLVSDADCPIEDPTPASYNQMPTALQTTHTCVSLYEPDEQNPGLGGAVWHSNRLTPGQTLRVSHRIEDWAGTGDRSAIASFSLAGRQSTGFLQYKPEITGPELLANTPNATPVIVGQGSTVMQYVTTTGSMFFGADDALGTVPDGTYAWQIDFAPNDGIDYLALERSVMIYPRRNSMAGRRQLIMHLDEAKRGTNLAIADAPPTTRVFNVTDMRRVYRHLNAYDSTTGTITASVDRDYQGASSGGNEGVLVAFDIAAQHTPVQFAGRVPNQNIHGRQTPDMLVVTTDELLPYAGQLAQAHRDFDGYTVLVVTQQQVFDEFAGGTPTAMAVRRMVKMFYDRNPWILKYLLLYGPAHWDQRQILAKAPCERLLTYEVEAVVADNYAVRHGSINFATDNYFGMIDDDFKPARMHRGTVSIGIGRLPVENTRQAAEVNAKLIGAIANPPGADAYANVVLASDDGDSNRHLQQSENLAEEMLLYRPEFTFMRAHNSLYPRDKKDAAEARKIVRNGLLSGAGLFSYTGHGRPEYFTAEYLWSQSHAAATHNKVLPLAMLATCDTYMHDRTETGIAEAMVMQPRGGAIAAVASCRSVYLDFNQTMNLAVARSYSSAAAHTAIGDIYRNAFNNAQYSNSLGTTDLYLNNLCYNLCGDPGMRIAAPSHNIAVTTLNEADVSGNDADTPATVVAPLSRVSLGGVINDQYLMHDKTFEGTVTVRIYEAPRTMPVIPLDKYDLEQNVTVDETPLVTAVANVTGGTWHTDFLVPRNAFTGKNRVVMTAVSADNDPKSRRYATGRFHGLEVGGDEAEVQDGRPLAITGFYIDSPTFEDGGTVGTDFTVFATIDTGDAGLSVSPVIGNAPRVTIDGTRSLDGAANAFAIGAGGTAAMALPVSGTGHGRHTLTLSVADNAGNRIQRTIGFNVAGTPPAARLTCQKPHARTAAVIALEHDADTTPVCRLLVRDHSGNTVRTADNCTFPYVWDLCDNDGNRVADGHYSVSALLSGPDLTPASTPALGIVVIK